MNRRPLSSTGFFASAVVVLVTVLSACTDPNTMRTHTANGSNDPPEHESRLAR